MRLCMKATLKKSERLSSKKVIGSLFDKGSENTKSVFLYPFRVSYFLQELSNENTEPTLPQMLISVSKRYFKHAVDAKTFCPGHAEADFAVIAGTVA